MPKYLYIGSYTHEGAKGLAKEGAAGRRAPSPSWWKALGGKLEAFYLRLRLGRLLHHRRSPG